MTNTAVVDLVATQAPSVNSTLGHERAFCAQAAAAIENEGGSRKSWYQSKNAK